MADCYNLKTAGKWLELIPGPNLRVATFRYVANSLPAKVFALEPMVETASMRKSDPPAVILVSVSALHALYPTTVTRSENRPKAGKNTVWLWDVGCRMGTITYWGRWRKSEHFVRDLGKIYSVLHRHC